MSTVTDRQSSSTRRNAVKSLFVLGLLLLPAAAEKPQEFRVLTFNLRYANPSDKGSKAWSARRESAAETIAKDAPDFVGLQEALRPMLDDLKPRLPGYAEIGVGRDDGKTNGEYSAILYRNDRWQATDSGTFWLSDTPEVPGSKTWGNGTTRICTWARFKHQATQREIAVFNAHLDHQSQPSREKAAGLILERLKALPGGLPAVLMGDFNATADNPAITRLTAGSGALTDVWLSHHRDTPSSAAGTFHDFSGNTGGPRIDFILTSTGISSSASEIVRQRDPNGNPPSDHFPVRATLLLR